MSELKLPYINTVMLAGRLTMDPKSIGKGEVPGVMFGIAATSYRKGGGSKATYVDCTAWDKTAEFILTLRKGDAILVTGALDSYAKRTETATITKLQVKVWTVQYLERGGSLPAAELPAEDHDGPF